MVSKLIEMHHDQRGITGLETAIILIAFVVVAAVFAYTILSAGLFSTQKGQQAVYHGLEEAKSTLELKGSVVGYRGEIGGNSTLCKVDFIVTNVITGDPMDFTPPYEYDGNGNLTPASGSDDKVQISFNDENVYLGDCAWTVSWLGKHGDDNLLENTEKALITVWLHDIANGIWSDGDSAHFLAGNRVGVNHIFNLELKPPKGAVLTIERITPPRLDPVMDFH